MNAKTATLSLLIIAAALGLRGLFTDAPLWETIVSEIASHAPITSSPYNDGTVCVYAKVDDQAICFDLIDHWYGEDAVPVYYVEAGVLRLF